MSTVTVDREAWLTGASEILLADLIGPAATVAKADPAPPFRVSVGWSRGQRGGRKVLGSCHPRRMSADGVNEVFIAPSVADPVLALSVLVHELVHAADDCRDHHQGRFRSMARMVGLVAPMRSTTAGPTLEKYLRELAPALGAYPHQALDDATRTRQPTRMLACECSGCHWKCRTTAIHVTAAMTRREAWCPSCGREAFGLLPS